MSGGIETVADIIKREVAANRPDPHDMIDWDVDLGVEIHWLRILPWAIVAVGVVAAVVAAGYKS